MGAVEATLLEPQAVPVAKPCKKIAAGESEAPDAGGGELLLWVLAGDRQCEAEGRRALGLSIAEAKAVRETCASRYERVRQLRCLGALLTHEELALLFRARLAELLLRSDSASDLAALLRVFDKVPQRVELLESSPGQEHELQYQPDGNELSSLDLAECVAEAQRLLAEIEAETGPRLQVSGDRLQQNDETLQATSDALRQRQDPVFTVTSNLSPVTSSPAEDEDE